MSPLQDAQTLIRTVKETLNRRRAQRDWTEYSQRRGPLEQDFFHAVIYFADMPINLYQMRQWYEPMRQLALDHPIAVITREAITADALRRECPLPVVLLPTTYEIEQWLDTQRVAMSFYVNQNTRNFQMMRFSEPSHVFISHGESDKAYMSSNQLKAYDYSYIAGAAARERIERELIDFDSENKLIEIGRPQVDITYDSPNLPSDDRTTVLYAPTWEGDRPSMSYSSLVSHSAMLISGLLADSRYRVIYRPHPRTGAYDPTFMSAHETVMSLIGSANEADPAAAHMVDIDTSFGWHLNAADLCIADISAVAFDWLATGKPLILTQPDTAEAKVDTEGLTSRVKTLQAADCQEISLEVERAFSRTTSLAYAQIVKHYFGDTTPGASLQRFLDSSHKLIVDRWRKTGRVWLS